tara:strand:+ start:309 stop:476 length:168 start_codon:yes stop_codon:yes gene_type:complete
MNKMLNTEIKPTLKEALENILYMYLDDEHKHYEEEPCDNHIYKSLQTIKEHLNND